MATTKEYWRFWLWRDYSARIITINTALWIIIAAPMLFLPVSEQGWWVRLFALPSYPQELPYRFWTVVTYMFSQYDFLHLLVNMLWLMLFGRLLEMLLGHTKMLWLYIAGGIAGALAFVTANAISVGTSPFMIGASCAVISLVTCSAIMMPSFKVKLLLFGDVKIIWIAVSAIVLFVILEPSLYVSIAHCGGILAGAAYALWRRLPKRMPSKSKPQTSYPSDEEQLDALLAKVGRSGYASLSTAEGQRLFDLSQKIKR